MNETYAAATEVRGAILALGDTMEEIATTLQMILKEMKIHNQKLESLGPFVRGADKRGD